MDLSRAVLIKHTILIYLLLMCDLAGSGSRIVRKEKKISIEKYFDESE